MVCEGSHLDELRETGQVLSTGADSAGAREVEFQLELADIGFAGDWGLGPGRN